MTRKVLAAGLFLIIFVSNRSFSDELMLKDGSVVKGLILNEYKDRVVISTSEGELFYMKQDINSASYSSKTGLLLQKARNQVKQGLLVKAYYTYKEVLDLDDTISEAAERIGYLARFIGSKMRRNIRSKISNTENTDRMMAGRSPEDISGKAIFILSPGDKYVEISGIHPSGENIIKDGVVCIGDKIVSVWGEMAAFMSVDEVRELISSGYENKIIIQRSFAVKLNKEPFLLKIIPFYRSYSDVLGAKIEITREGFEIKHVREKGPFVSAGIKEGDFLWSFDGGEIKYVPLDELYDRIKRSAGKEITLEIRREIVFW